MHASWDRSREPATVSRDWSHDALRTPVWEAHPKALQLPFAVYLPYVDFEFKPDPWDDVSGLASFGRPTPQTLLCWTGSWDSWGEELERSACLVGSIATYDRIRDRLANPKAAKKMGRDARDRAMRAVDGSHRYLRGVLAAGLERRRGTQLDRRELRTFVQLAARIPSPRFERGGLQVCEACDLVFPPAQSNARKCANCRKSRRKAYPKSDGGQHTGTTGRPGDGTLRYFVECTSCRTAVRFTASDAGTHLCPSCGSNAGRQRRFRDQSPDVAPVDGLRQVTVSLELDPRGAAEAADSNDNSGD